MEVYDQRVSELGLPKEITSLQSGLIIHETMIQFETKAHFANDICAMPHYRGEQKFGWDISPGIFRSVDKKSTAAEVRQLEIKALQEFEAAVTSNFGEKALRTLFYNKKHGKDWDLLFQAQHAGIKTRLLDWTPEIIQALYFATEKSPVEDVEKADGQLWVFLARFHTIRSHNEFPVKDTFYDQDPSSLSEGCLINSSIYLDDLEARLFETRMYKQKGRFYLSSKANFDIPMNHQEEVVPLLFRFRIPADNKAAIREELKERGITREYLYGKENPAHQSMIDTVNEEIYKS
ncbi:MAG: hypothetical protein JWP69_1689 [Flaviaesturariibacter sp.]|nr:hypothetical protein [Flaviaesturariibacter sp.]